MEKTKKQAGILLKSIGIGTSFLLLSGIVFILVFGESLLNKNLTNYVAKKTNHLYQLSYSNIKLRLNPLSISVTDMDVAPDIELAQQIKKTQPDKSFYAFRSKEIKLSHLKLWTLIKHKSLHCKEITTLEPFFEISDVLNNKKDSTQSYDEAITGLHPFLSRSLREIVVDQINFVDANYSLYHSVNNFKQISNADRISIRIKKFVSSHQLLKDKGLYFDSEDILIRMDGFKNDMGDSLHLLTIDTLDYSLKSSDIYANGFHLKPVRQSSPENLFDVYVPYAYLQSRNMSSFSFKDTIDIHFLQFDQPKIKFFQKENTRQTAPGESKQLDLYSLFKSQFLQIKIDSFLLNDAELEIFKQPEKTYSNQSFESIHITLNNFVIDSTSRTNENKLLYADDILMRINGYQLNLNKNQHLLSAGELFVSTKDEVLKLDNIRIKPPNKTDLTAYTKINVNCNALVVEGVDFKKLYHHRVLPTSKISIDNPQIQLSNKNLVRADKKSKEQGLLLEILSEYLIEASSETVEILNGSMRIEEMEDNMVEGYFETDFNFLLRQFKLKTKNWQNIENFFVANEFDIRFNDYKMRLADNLHRLQVNKIEILSNDNTFQIDSVLFEPVIENVSTDDMKSFGKSELFRLFVPKIAMTSVNLQDAFFNRTLKMDSFQVTNPEIYFENFGALKKEKDKKDPIEIFPLLFNYMFDFDVENINIPNGKITWINHSQKGKTIALDNDFSAHFGNFRLNEEELKKETYLFSEQFSITVKNQLFELSDKVHILEAAEINLSTKTSGLQIKNAKLYANESSPKFDSVPGLYNVQLPLLEIKDFDFIGALYFQEYLADKFILENPKIEVYSTGKNLKTLDFNKFRILLPEAIKSMYLNEFRINGGEVSVFNSKSSGVIAQSKFKVDLSIPDLAVTGNEGEKAQIKPGNVLTTLRAFRTPLGKNHDLEIARIDYNRGKKSFVLNNIKVIPGKIPANENQFDLSIPELKFNGFELDSALLNTDFIFDKISVSNPVISIKLSDSNQKNESEFEIARNFDLYPYVKNYVNSIRVNSLLLKQLDLNMNWFDKPHIERRFNLRFEDIFIAENHPAENVFNSKEFELITTNLRSESKNKFYEFSVDSFIYNSRQHKTSLKNIEVSPLKSAEEFNASIPFQKDYFKVKCDFIEMQGLNEDAYLRHNLLNADALLIGKSNIDISRDKRIPFNENQRPPWFQDLLMEVEQVFAFDSVILLPSTLKYSETTDFSNLPGYVTFNELNAKFYNFTNNSDLLAEQPFLNVQASANFLNEAPLQILFTFDLNNENYRHWVKGKLNKLQLTSINSFLENTSPVAVENGSLNSLDFDLAFNGDTARGNILLLYNDLEISIYKKRGEELKKANLATLLANKLALETNSENAINAEPFPVYFERDEKRAITNFWIKSLFNGVRDAIGLKSKKE